MLDSVPSRAFPVKEEGHPLKSEPTTQREAGFFIEHIAMKGGQSVENPIGLDGFDGDSRRMGSVPVDGHHADRHSILWRAGRFLIERDAHLFIFSEGGLDDPEGGFVEDSEFWFLPGSVMATGRFVARAGGVGGNLQ